MDLHSAILFQKAYRENNLPQKVFTFPEQMGVWLLYEIRGHLNAAQDKPVHSENNWG